MSDDRVEVVLREKVADPRIWRRCWDWLKDNFPLVTRSGGRFAEARIAQEEAKARLIHSQSDVESARAEQIRAQTAIMLSDLDRTNAETAERSGSGPWAIRDAERVRALEELSRLLESAERMGIRIVIEDVSETSQALLASPDDQETET
jgi:hypothetical protein